MTSHSAWLTEPTSAQDSDISFHPLEPGQHPWAASDIDRRSPHALQVATLRHTDNTQEINT